jgi:hypothetical protein
VTRLLFAAAAALTLASPALARERVFTHEGVTYSYTSTVQDDAKVLEGRSSAGAPFRLVVRNGWVSGTVADSRVSFRAPKARARPLLVAQR